MSGLGPIDFLTDAVYAMEPNKGEESGKMYLPDDQGEYMPKAGAPSFSVQGLSDALTALDTEVTAVQPPSEEFALLLEVMMADCPGRLCPPMFSWNVGMVMHILKGDPTLRDLDHIQVDGPSMAYLFFFDKQGHRGLTLDATQTLRTHVEEVFAEWISCSVHFAVIPHHWQKDGAEQLQLQNGANKGPGQSIKAVPH